LALGHEIATDVVEIQPIRLSREKAAWALASALREALARRLGVESTELGIAVDARSTSFGGRTYSIFLYDRAAGGAGFAPRLLDLFIDTVVNLGA
jgi:CO/xanthine dehydrogenase Mo-binding subunit